MSTLKTINIIHPSGSTNNIVNDASGNITVGNNLTVTGTLTGSTGVMNIGSGQLYKDTSGNLLVGTTSLLYGSGQNGVSVKTTGGYAIATQPGANNYNALTCLNAAGTIVGSVYSTASATSYLTSSDYRLKNSVAPMITGLATVAALKPVTYKWNVDDSDGEGFLAHELQEVIPHAVTGEKDAVDADGKPIHQGVDYSKIVVHLVAAIQEQQAAITALTARVAALEDK